MCVNLWLWWDNRQRTLELFIKFHRNIEKKTLNLTKLNTIIQEKAGKLCNDYTLGQILEYMHKHLWIFMLNLYVEFADGINLRIQQSDKVNLAIWLLTRGIALLLAVVEDFFPCNHVSKTVQIRCEPEEYIGDVAEIARKFLQTNVKKGQCTCSSTLMNHRPPLLLIL